MIAWAIIAIAALLLSWWDAIVRPSSARCPEGFAAEGVRPSGATTCRPVPPPNCGEPTGEHTQPCVVPDVELPRAIHCTGGTMPIVVDARTIGCQHGGWTQ